LNTGSKFNMGKKQDTERLLRWGGKGELTIRPGKKGERGGGPECSASSRGEVMEGGSHVRKEICFLNNEKVVGQQRRGGWKRKAGKKVRGLSLITMLISSKRGLNG